MSNNEWHSINTLLVYLRTFQVGDLVDMHYQEFQNDAPGILIRQQIKEVQAVLDGWNAARRN